MKQSLFGIRAFSCNRSEPDIANLILERCISFNNKSLCLSKKPRPICNRENDYQNGFNHYHRKPCKSLSFFGENKTPVSPNRKYRINLAKEKQYFTHSNQKDVRKELKVSTAGHQLKARIPELSPLGKSSVSQLLNASIEPLLSKPLTASRPTKYFKLFITKKNHLKVNSSFLFIDCHHLRESIPTKERYNLQAQTPAENKFVKFKQLTSKCDDQLNSFDFKVLQRKQHNNSCLFHEKSNHDDEQQKEAPCLPRIDDSSSKRKVILMKVKKDNI